MRKAAQRIAEHGGTERREGISFAEKVKIANLTV